MAADAPLAILLALALAGCSFADECTDTIAQRVPSPDGTREAIVFGRSCGATVGDSIQVWVGPAGGRGAHVPGNALAVDTVPPAAGVKAMWTGPQRLLLHRPAGARVVREASQVEGVAIAILAR